MGLSMHRVLFGQCVCSFHELCVRVRVLSSVAIWQLYYSTV